MLNIPNTIYCTSAQLANACYLQCLTKIEKMLLNNLLCPTIDDTGWGKADFICNFSRQIEFKIEMCREFQFLIHCLPLHHKMLLRRSSYQIFIHPYWNIWVHRWWGWQPLNCWITLLSLTMDVYLGYTVVLWASLYRTAK